MINRFSSNVLHFLSGVRLHCLLHLDSVPIPSLDLSYLTFLDVLNYVVLLKDIFNLTLQKDTYLLFPLFFLLFIY